MDRSEHDRPGDNTGNSGLTEETERDDITEETERDELPEPEGGGEVENKSPLLSHLLALRKVLLISAASVGVAFSRCSIWPSIR